VVYIGDDERDVQAANAANMRSIGALWGYRPLDDDPLRWQADALAEIPRDLIELGLMHSR
jgi:phosphoglycolate phosphatase